MAELSAESGVPIPTIKYYLREGLLPPGERTSPNQARYGEEHVRRLKLVRVLVDVGGLSIATVREVLDGLASLGDLHHLLGVTQRGLTLRRPQADEKSRAWATSLLERLAADRHWRLKEGNPVVESAIGTLAAFAELGHTEVIDNIDGYADLANQMGELDVAGVVGLPAPELIVEAAVVGTVLGDTLFAALRRLAQEAASARRFRPA